MAIVTGVQREREIESAQAFQREWDQSIDAKDQAERHIASLKEYVLAGLRYREIFEIYPGMDVELRPITDLEYGKVKAKVLEGLKKEDLANAEDLAKVLENNRQAKYIAVAFSLSCNGETWTPEEVSLLPPGIPDQMYNRVGIISGFTPGEGTPNR